MDSEINDGCEMPLIEVNGHVNCAKWKIEHFDSCSALIRLTFFDAQTMKSTTIYITSIVHTPVSRHLLSRKHAH